jgi:SAM-dependent methyltransferase
MAEQDRRESRLESQYYAHMGFDPEHKRDVLRFYVPMFEESGDGAEESRGGKHGPVLELGCGRGEFLALLREAGIEGRGVDLDAGMVEMARADGIDVVHADAIEYLHADPAPGPYQGVFCAHFLEHLVPDQVASLLDGVRRVLAPGGRFVAVTPNPACYAVLTHDFWWDPTHVRFYDRPLVEFLCRQAGFEVESSGTNPANHPGPPPEYLAREPVVYPGVGDLVAAAMSKLTRSLATRAPAAASPRDQGAAGVVSEAAGLPRGGDPVTHRQSEELGEGAADRREAPQEAGEEGVAAPGDVGGAGSPRMGRERSGEREEVVLGYPDHTWAYELAHVVNVLGDRLQEATQSLRELRTAHDNLVWGLYQGNETFVVARR